MAQQDLQQSECPFGGRKHKWFSVPTLATQFDVDPETIRRRLWKVDHVKIGQMARIPACQVKRLFDDIVQVSDSS